MAERKSIITISDGGTSWTVEWPPDPPRPPERLEDGTLEEALELAYWRFDAMQGRQGEPYKSRPQSERDAFKGAVRALWAARGGADITAEERSALGDLLVSLEVLPINEPARRAIAKVLGKETL